MSTFDSTFGTTFQDTGVYSEATVAQAPSANLTDFTFIVDLSNLPQSWWDNVDTYDPTKGRVRKSDGTELAADWGEFDNVAQTGWVRILWSGTVNGDETVRIFAPDSGKTSYLATDTYGAYNAYDANWGAYYPDGGGADRTVNQNNGTSNGGVTVGGATGQVGGATQYDGVDDYVDIGFDASIKPASAITVISWGRLDSDVTDSFPKLINTDNDPSGFQIYNNGTDYFFQVNTTGGIISGTGPVNTLGQLFHFAGRYNGSEAVLFMDGALGTTEVGTGDIDYTGSSVITIGNRGPTDARHWKGLIDGTQIHSTDRSDSWISYEYSQTNNNASFWGTWSEAGVELSGGSDSFVVLSSLGAGNKQVSLGASSAVWLSSLGSGEKKVLTGSSATNWLNSVGLGAKQIIDGASSSILINSFGDAQKDIVSGSDGLVFISATGGATSGTAGGADAVLFVDTSQFGTKSIWDGQSTNLLVNSTGGAEKGISSGSDSIITISAVGAGEALDVLSGGSDALVTLKAAADGLKSAVDGANSQLVITDTGEGIKGAETGNDATVLIATDGDGNKQVISGAQAKVLIDAYGSGVADFIEHVAEIKIALKQNDINATFKQLGIKGIFNG